MKRLKLILTICIIIPALLVGCTTKPVSSVPDVYKFAIIAPITGNYAEYGVGFKVGTQMAADEINAAGGINGKKIEFVVHDSKADAKESADIARMVVEDKDVLAVIGDFTSSCCMANAPILGDAGLVQLSPTASHGDYAAMNDYMFSICGRQDAEGPNFAKNLLGKYMQAKDVGVVYINNDWGKDAFTGLKEELVKNNINLVSELNYVEGEKDFISLLTKARNKKPDTLALILHANDTAQILNQINQMGWDIPVAVMGPGTSMQIIELAGDNAEGLLMTSSFFITEENTKAWEWSQEFLKRAGFEATIYPALAYDTVYLLKEAIENTDGDITRESIKTGLKNMGEFIGLTGYIKFNPAGDITRKYFIVGIEGGRFVQLTDLSYSD